MHSFVQMNVTRTANMIFRRMRFCYVVGMELLNLLKLVIEGLTQQVLLVMLLVIR